MGLALSVSCLRPKASFGLVNPKAVCWLSFFTMFFLTTGKLFAENHLRDDVCFMNELIDSANENLEGDPDRIWTIFEQVLSLHSKIQHRSSQAKRVDSKPTHFFREPVFCQAGAFADFNGWDFRRGFSWWDRAWVGCCGLQTSCYSKEMLKQLHGGALEDAIFFRWVGLSCGTLFGPGLQVFALQALVEPLLPQMYSGGACVRCGLPLERNLNIAKVSAYLLILKNLYKTPHDWLETDYCIPPVGQFMEMKVASRPPSEN